MFILIFTQTGDSLKQSTEQKLLCSKPSISNFFVSFQRVKREHCPICINEGNIFILWQRGILFASVGWIGWKSVLLLVLKLVEWWFCFVFSFWCVVSLFVLIYNSSKFIHGILISFWPSMAVRGGCCGDISCWIRTGGFHPCLSSAWFTIRGVKRHTFPQGKHTFGWGPVFKGHIINSCKESAPLNIAR